MRRSTVCVEKADLIGRVHSAERVKGTRGGNDSALANRARETEKERANRRRKLAPTGWPHWAASERERACERKTAADRRGPPVRRHGRAAWLGLVGRLGCFPISLFSGFSNSFSISFSIGFSNPNSN
jgi:hypothetical protein